MAKAFYKSIDKIYNDIKEHHDNISILYNNALEYYTKHENDINKNIIVSNYLTEKYNNLKELYIKKNKYIYDDTSDYFYHFIKKNLLI